MQFIVNARGQRMTDSFDLRQLIDACRKQSFEATEARQQPLSPFCTYAVDMLECRGIARLAAPGSMSSHA